MQTDQRYVATIESGNRVKVFVAENAHATYFRDEAICTEKGKVGTQVQYKASCSATGYDNIVRPERVRNYKILSLDVMQNEGIYDWPGHWGFDKEFGPDVPGPQNRYVEDSTLGKFRMDLYPVLFHNRCRKIISGQAAPETALIP